MNQKMTVVSRLTMQFSWSYIAFN